MEMTKSNLSSFRAEFNEAMEGLREKYDVDIDLGNIRYTDNDFKSTVSVGNKKTDEEKHTEIVANLIKKATSTGYAFTPEMIGQEMHGNNGEDYIFEGIKPRATKKICVIKSKSNGKEYVCNPEFIGIRRIM